MKEISKGGKERGKGSMDKTKLALRQDLKAFKYKYNC